MFCSSGDLAFRFGPLVTAMVPCANGPDREHRFLQAIGIGMRLKDQTRSPGSLGEDSKAVARFAASDTK